MYYKGTVALEFQRRAYGACQRLGVLPAAFNPPTRAHLAIARAALDAVDEVLFVLPREFPHKSYAEATLEQRLEMLLAATRDEPRYSIAASDGGLFIDIANECRDAYGPETALLFICGRDAAERIVGWDYGAPEAFVRMLDRFELLVAPRGGHYNAPPEIRHRAHALKLPADIDSISATDIRDRIRRGEPWEHLVPSGIAAQVRRIYAEL